METYCIVELLHKNVPIPVIKEFLASAPEYNEQWTAQQIRYIISADYDRWAVETIAERAPEFIDFDNCKLHSDL